MQGDWIVAAKEVCKQLSVLAEEIMVLPLDCRRAAKILLPPVTDSLVLGRGLAGIDASPRIVEVVVRQWLGHLGMIFRVGRVAISVRFVHRGGVLTA
jgi:hypothetical protein